MDDNKTKISVNQLDLSLQNVIDTIIGKTIFFINWVVSKIIMATKGMTVVTIKLLYHATLAQMKKHHGWKTTIKNAVVVISFQQNANSAQPGPLETSANKVFLRKEMVMAIKVIVSQQNLQLKHQLTTQYLSHATRQAHYLDECQVNLPFMNPQVSQIWNHQEKNQVCLHYNYQRSQGNFPLMIPQ